MINKFKLTFTYENVKCSLIRPNARMFLTSQGKVTRKIAVIYGMEIVRGSMSKTLQ